MRTPAIRVLAVTLILNAFCCLSNAQKSPSELAKAELNIGAFRTIRLQSTKVRFSISKTHSGQTQLKTARLYLATAHAQRCIPGVDTADNIKSCEAAIATFKQLLNLDPEDVTALKGIASLNFNMKRFDEAKDSYQQIAKIDPKDPEAVYSIAVIDWTQSYKTRMDERNALHLEASEPLIDQPTCSVVRSKISENVDEGMEMLKRALILRPDYDDAMAYMNLIYRERADIQCNDRQAYEADTKSCRPMGDAHDGC